MRSTGPRTQAATRCGEPSSALLACPVAHDPDPRGQARGRRAFRQGRERHGRHRGADRAADASHQRPHGAPARAQARPPLAPWPPHAGRPSPEVPQLPPEEGSRALPLADPRARSTPVSTSMAVIAAGQPVPELSLARYDGEPFTRADLLGRRTVLVFYPFAFSPTCTDQLGVYNELLADFAERGATLYGVSCDATWSQEAFRQQLGVQIEQLSDFEPKGAVCRAFGVLHPGGFPQRALVLVGADGVVEWSYEAPSPGDLPGANLIFDALDAAAV